MLHPVRDVDADALAWFLGYDGDDPDAALARIVAKTGEARLPLVILAYIGASAEDNLANVGRTWAYRPGLAARWLTWLADALGYPLTEAEDAVRADAMAAAAAVESINEDGDDLGDDTESESPESCEGEGG